MSLMLGKLPPEVLKKYLLKMSGASSRDLVVAPTLGIDFGVVRLGSAYLIVSSDPVTGAGERVGWYAVNVSANDVATSGSRPRFLQSVILLSEHATESDVREISSEMHSAAKKLGITVVGGHTELTPGLRRPIVITTAFAISKSFVTAAEARDGDTIVMTKTAGVEGTAILAHSKKLRGRGLDSSLLGRARGFFKRMSVVDEAETGYKTGMVHAMHDCTEGGVLGSAYEMAYASGKGFRILEREIPVAAETRGICSVLKVDPLRLISSGTLLLAVKPGGEAKVKDSLAKKGFRSSVIGKFTGRKRVLIAMSGSEEEIRTSGTDEIWRI